MTEVPAAKSRRRVLDSNPRKVRTVRNIILLSSIVVAVVVVFSIIVGHLADRPSTPSGFGAPGLPAIPAAPDFAPLDKDHAVPANVLDALEVPAGSTVVTRTNTAAVAPFDGTVSYTSPDSPARVAQFFPAALARKRWKVERQTSPVLGLIEGADGNYWEVGITISGLSSGPGGGLDGTQFKVELYTYEPGS